MKLCCFPVRPLLYTLATLGILRSGAQIYWISNVVRSLPSVITIFYNLALIYAAKKKEIKTLKFAQRIALASFCLSFIPFVLFPVFSASLVASGKIDNITGIPDEFMANWTIPDRRFFMGSLVGFTVEVGTAFVIGVELLKYLLITKCWRKAVELDQMVMPDNFHTP